jgi:hypothetical protein
MPCFWKWLVLSTVRLTASVWVCGQHASFVKQSSAPDCHPLVGGVNPSCRENCPSPAQAWLSSVGCLLLVGWQLPLAPPLLVAAALWLACVLCAWPLTSSNTFLVLAALGMTHTSPCNCGCRLWLSSADPRSSGSTRAGLGCLQASGAPEL